MLNYLEDNLCSFFDIPRKISYDEIVENQDIPFLDYEPLLVGEKKECLDTQVFIEYQVFLYPGFKLVKESLFPKERKEIAFSEITEFFLENSFDVFHLKKCNDDFLYFLGKNGYKSALRKIIQLSFSRYGR